MMFLGVFLGFIAFCFFAGVHSDYNKFKIQSSVNNVVDKTKLRQCYKGDTLKWTIILIVIGIAFALGANFCIMNSFRNNSPSKWDSLTKEEKQWYKDNYGDGQYKKYKDAVDSYKKTKK